jgi:hypothetical protein
MDRINILLLLAVIIILMVYLKSLFHSNNVKFLNCNNEVKQITTTERPIQRNVFIDLNSNSGSSLLDFFGLNPHGKIRTLLGTDLIENTNWDIYIFASNPVFGEQLFKLKKEIDSMQLNYIHDIKIYNNTIGWNQDGNREIYINETKKNLNCVDVSRIIKKYERSDIIVIKMDKVTEKEIIFDFINKDVLKLIDVILTETNYLMSPIDSIEGLFSKFFHSRDMKVLII